MTMIKQIIVLMIKHTIVVENVVEEQLKKLLIVAVIIIETAPEIAYQLVVAVLILVI